MFLPVFTIFSVFFGVFVFFFLPLYMYVLFSTLSKSKGVDSVINRGPLCRFSSGGDAFFATVAVD